MNTTSSSKLGITLAGVLALTVLPAHADTFGTGPNTFTIDFVTIGNAGNANDAGAGGGITSSPYGGVSSGYRMGTYEISQSAITNATAGGLANVIAGVHSAGEPAAGMSWYEAAAFVNWLNTSTGHQAAYQIDTGVTALTLWTSAQAWQVDGENLYRHKDAYYFLPSEDEWYKAAYHKNDGVTANYWDYATGSNSVPTQELIGGTTAGSAVYDSLAEAGFPGDPALVNLAGGLSSYGTMGQNGNVYEWQESAFAAPNSSPSEDRVIRGGSWQYGNFNMLPTFRSGIISDSSGNAVGFRVAGVPEPSCAVLMIGSGLVFLARRRRAAAASAMR